MRENRWPVIIAALAVAVRIIYLLELSRSPEAMVPMVDEKWHWLWANEIVHSSFWGTGAYFRAPLYPYFLALLSWITGGSVLASKMLQVIVCAGTAWFVYSLAEKLFNRRVGIVAGTVYALYGTLVMYETMFLIPAIFLFFCVWALYRLVAYRQDSRWKTWLLTGIILGLATISRPNILIVLPFLMLWLYFQTDNDRSYLKRARRPALMLAGVLICIAPVTIRNLAVTGDFIAMSSQGGINLYLGNNPEADGLTMLMPEVDLDESVSWDMFEKVTRTAAETESGRRLSESELSSFWTGKAFDFIVSNPGRFLSLVWKKTVYLMTGFENSDNLDIYHQRSKSFLYSLLLWREPIYFPFGLLIPLTLLGVYVLRKDFGKLLPIYIFVIAYIPSIVLFLVTARHRLPLVPFMIIIACAGTITLIRSLRNLSVKQIGTVLAIFLIPLFFLNRTYYGQVGVGLFQTYLNEGIRYQQLGDNIRAEQSYLRADREFPYSATLINNLAYVQFLLGKNAQAESNYYRALAMDTAFSAIYNNLGLLMRRNGNADSALVLYRQAIERYKPDRAAESELNQYYLNVAGAFEAKRMLDSADAAYRAAIAIRPLYAGAYFKASGFYARIGAYPQADSLFIAGQAYGEPTAADLFNWGLSYVKRREFSTAINTMRAVLHKDPTFYQAYYCIAVGYHENLMARDSVEKYLDLTFRYNPEYKPALELRRLLSGGN